MARIDIERIKIEVNLVEVASLYGYGLNKQKSTVNSVSLKSEHDSIIVKKDGDNHWVYFNVHIGKDKGSVIDFILYRNPELSFPQALRQIQDDYLGVVLDAPIERSAAKLKPIVRDRIGVCSLINQMSAAKNNRYLASRAIEDATMQNARFKGVILQDNYLNAVFPHIDEAGICGAEMRNFKFRGFPRGGIKSLWLSNCFKKDDKLFVVEGAIDALSHFVLLKNETTRYISIGGQPNAEAWVFLGKIARIFYENGGCIISGVDNDEGGDKLHQRMITAIHLPIYRDKPSCKDWNVVLMSSLGMES